MFDVTADNRFFTTSKGTVDLLRVVAFDHIITQYDSEEPDQQAGLLLVFYMENAEKLTYKGTGDEKILRSMIPELFRAWAAIRSRIER